MQHDHSDSATHQSSFAAVFAAEIRRIVAIRLNRRRRYDRVPTEVPDLHADGPIEVPADLRGLALSGGGIRSAAFCLGVLQSFANRDDLRRIDYLSTVSGGGYIGSALTWMLSRPYAAELDRNRARPAGGLRALGVGVDDSPLGRRGCGGKTATTNDRIDHIRCFGNYLRPTPELWAGSAVATVLQNMAYTVLLWFPPLVLILILVDSLMYQLGAATAGTPFWRPAIGQGIGDSLGWLWLGTLACTVLSMLRVSSTKWRGGIEVGKSGERRAYRHRLDRQRAMGWYLAAGVAFAVFATLPHVVSWLDIRNLDVTLAVSGAVGLAATLFGLLGRLPNGWLNLLRPVLIRVGVVLLGYSLLVSSLLLPRGTMASLAALGLADWAFTATLGLSIVLALASLWFACATRLNSLSLHGMYRDRLMETFLADPPARQEALGGGLWNPADHAAVASLQEMCDEAGVAPYHMINTNIILVGSRNSAVRARGGESFVLAPLWSGSDTTGWRRTERLVFDPKTRDTLSLASAVAISAAAANPNAGPGGGGLTRSAVISRLMMLLSIRLAFWLPNPHPDRRVSGIAKTVMGVARRLTFAHPEDDRPRCLYPGVAAFGGWTHSERAAYVELSDGGHFDNLGLYELLRRRVPTIVVCDVGADPDFAFADLANLIERARVDFGVDIDFGKGDKPVADVQPGTGGTTSFGATEIRLAKRGWAEAVITYPAMPSDAEFRSVLNRPECDAQRLGINPGPLKGRLVYLKSTLISGLPPDVLGYRAEEPHFPHQTTADQFFDERQFEAYRELGYRIAESWAAEQSSRGRPPLDAGDPIAA